MSYERELLEPGFRPPSFYFTLTPEFATGVGFPSSPTVGDRYTPYDGSEWEYGNAAAVTRWVMVAYPPTGDPYRAVKEREKEAHR